MCRATECIAATRRVKVVLRSNGYSKRPTQAPSAPTVAINASAGNLNGTYTYKGREQK